MRAQMLDSGYLCTMSVDYLPFESSCRGAQHAFSP